MRCVIFLCVPMCLWRAVTLPLLLHACNPCGHIAVVSYIVCRETAFMLWCAMLTLARAVSHVGVQSS